MGVSIRLTFIRFIILGLNSSCIITSHKGYIAPQQFLKSKKNIIRTDGFYLSEYRNYERDFITFFSNGCYYRRACICESVESVRKEVKVARRYAYSEKRNWGGYWIEKDTILQLQYFGITGAGFLVAGCSVFDEKLIISNSNKSIVR